ncbi:MAG: cell division protein SepF [Oscillospiraceae bacterium]|nr:cell division protein SepF [Oscillospiraceae bacterium]
MSFWDNVKKFTQPYSDDEYEDYEDEVDQYEEEPAPRSSRRTSPFAGTAQDAAPAAPAATSSSFGGQVLSMSGKQEVVLFHAKSFDDTAKAADELRKKKAVILNMENVDKALTRRVVDFLSGSVYALDGRVKKVAQATYLFCPHNMEVIGDLESLQAESESYM